MKTIKKLKQYYKNFDRKFLAVAFLGEIEYKDRRKFSIDKLKSKIIKLYEDTKEIKEFRAELYYKKSIQKFWLYSQYVHALNQNDDVMTKNFQKDFVDLCYAIFASYDVCELRFNHRIS